MSDETLPPPNTSAIGILSSFRLKQLLEEWLGTDMASTLRLFCETSSVLYSHGFGTDPTDHIAKQIRNVQNLAGSKVLELLEVALSKNNLSKSSPQTLKALFLVLFGTILAVGYSKPTADCNGVSVYLYIN